MANVNVTNGGVLDDKKWLRHNFLTSATKARDRSRYRRSSGYHKFMDTTLGGNTAINAPYQFTRYADIKEKRLIPDIGRGMGRWYSENIDDFGHNVHFRLGVPTYSSLIGYIYNAVDAKTAMYASTGREPGILSGVATVIGGIINIAFWEISLVMMFVSIYNSIANSRFTYLKPTMFQYWKTVQTIVNAITTNLGITYSAAPPIGMRADAAKDNSEMSKVSAALTAAEQFPDIWKKHGGYDTSKGEVPDLDIHAIASRAQALQVRWYQAVEAAYDKGKLEQMKTADDVANYLNEAISKSEIAYANNKGNLNPALNFANINAYVDAFNKSSSIYTANIDEGQSTKPAEPTDGGWGAGISSFAEKVKAYASKTADAQADLDSKSFFQKTIDSFEAMLAATTSDNFVKLLKSEMRDGSQWISFRVANSADSVSESVSNSTETTGIFDIFNDISEKARSVMFNFSGGTGIEPLDAILKGAVTTVAEGLTNIADTGTAMKWANPFLAAMWGARLENPKRYSNSSSTLPTASYRFELRCGYASELSYLQDIVVPLAMLIAMSFPRGTGPQSYASPYYVQYYSKGRSQAAVGIVSSINITRGVGNAPWLKNGLPMGVDVEITIEPFHEMMYVPIQSGILTSDTGLFKSLMQENSMGDYIACLSGLGLVEQEYIGPKVRRRINNLIKNFRSVVSPSYVSMAIAHSQPGQLLSKLADATSVRK